MSKDRWIVMARTSDRPTHVYRSYVGTHSVRSQPVSITSLEQAREGLARHIETQFMGTDHWEGLDVLRRATLAAQARNLREGHRLRVTARAGWTEFWITEDPGK